MPITLPRAAHSGRMPGDTRRRALPSPIAPGTIMTLLGEQMGPNDGVSFSLQDGRVPFDVAGASVTVDGKPAPVLYAQGSQINFIAPWSLRTDGAKVPICVIDECRQLVPIRRHCRRRSWFVAGKFARSPRSTRMRPSIPRSIRRPSGTYVSVYLTGVGQIEGPMVDGGIAGFDLQRITAAAAATFTVTLQCAPSVA